MSSHYGGSHFASSHHDPNHYGGVSIGITIVPGGGIDDAMIRSRRKLKREEEEFMALLVATIQVIERE